MILTASPHLQTFAQKMEGQIYLAPLVFIFAKIFSFIIMWTTFSFFYLFFPNTKVKFGSAFLGGVLAGTLWQIAQWAYLYFQIGVAKYGAIYGTFAVVPLLLVWLYVGWTIILLGAEYAWAHQNLKSYILERQITHPSFAFREMLILEIMITIANNFFRGGQPLNSDDLSNRLQAPIPLVNELLQSLCDTKYLLRGAGEAATYLPARALETINMVNLLRDFQEEGNSPRGPLRHPSPKVQEILTKRKAAMEGNLGALTLRDMVEEEKKGSK